MDDTLGWPRTVGDLLKLLADTPEDMPVNVRGEWGWVQLEVFEEDGELYFN